MRKPFRTKDDRFFGGIGIFIGVGILVLCAFQSGNYIENVLTTFLWFGGGLVGTAVLFGLIALFANWVDKGE